MTWFSIPNGVIDRVRLGEIGRLDFLVYSVLAKHANEQGRAWPSQKTIATYCRADPKNVRASIEKLEKLGLITVTRPKSECGRPYGNEYTLAPLETEAQEPSSIAALGCVAPDRQGRQTPKNKTKRTRRSARSAGNYGQKKKDRPSSRY